MRNPSWQRLLAASLWTTILSHHSRNISSFVSRYELVSTGMTFWCNDCDALRFIYLSIYPSIYLYTHKYGLPLWLSSKESTCNAGVIRGAGSIPGSGRSPRGGMATHSNILAWRIPWTEEPASYSLWGHKESGKTEWLSLTRSCVCIWFTVVQQELTQHRKATISPPQKK